MGPTLPPLPCAGHMHRILVLMDTSLGCTTSLLQLPTKGTTSQPLRTRASLKQGQQLEQYCNSSAYPLRLMASRPCLSLSAVTPPHHTILW